MFILSYRWTTLFRAGQAVAIVPLAHAAAVRQTGGLRHLPPRRHRLVPEALARCVKDQRGGGRHDKPVVAGELGLELAGGPAGVARRPPGFLPPPGACDGAPE